MNNLGQYLELVLLKVWIMLKYPILASDRNKNSELVEEVWLIYQ